MQTFNLNYHKNTILLISMIAVPMVIAGLTLSILLALPSRLPEFVFIAIIVISVLFMVAILRWLINKVIIVPCQTTISHEGIFFALEKKSFLYRTNEFFSGWENVTSISEIFCSKTGRNFHRITFSNPTITANFSAIRYNELEADKFFTDLSYYQDTYMIAHLKNRKRVSQKWALVKLF